MNYWLGMFMMIFVFLGLVFISAQKSWDKEEACKRKGGVPITERGIYKACAKPEMFIQ